MTHPASPAEASPPAGRLVILAMALACGIAVANLYYSQPLLGLIAADLGVREGTVGLIPMATQIGYAVGLFLLVPLGDMLDRRRLILTQAGALTLALLLVALAPNLVILVIGSVAIGIAASIAQQIIPFAAELADERSRGRVVGTVMSGLLAGILLARVFSGIVGEHFGWRITYWLAALFTIGLAVMLGRILPAGQGRPGTRYFSLLASIGAVARRNPLLVKSSLVQASLFWGFSVFWSTLALYLASPRFEMGADVAGLFGILALVGVFAAPIAGRMADTRGPSVTIGAGVALVALGFLDFALVPGMVGLIIGVVVIDFGVQLAMVSHQARIFALEPAARSRINTVFMTTLFTFGALGSGAASLAWVNGGWIAVSCLGLAAAVAGLALHLLWHPPR